MKKIICLFLILLLLVSLCLPAFAEIEIVEYKYTPEEGTVFVDYYGKITQSTVPVLLYHDKNVYSHAIGPGVVHVSRIFGNFLYIVAYNTKHKEIIGWVKSEMVTPIDENEYLSSIEGDENVYHCTIEADCFLLSIPCEMAGESASNGEDVQPIIKSAKIEDGKFEVVIEKAVPYIKYGLTSGTTPGKTDSQGESDTGQEFYLEYPLDLEHETLAKTADGTNASALSDGNLTIICTVAGIVVGFLTAMFIFKKKKKPAVADGESKDEE